MGEADEYAVYLNQAQKLILTTPESDAIHIDHTPTIIL